LANVYPADDLSSGGFAVDSFLVGLTFSAEMGVQGSAVFFILVDVLVDSFVANFLVMLEFEGFGDLLRRPLFLGEFFFKEGKDLRC
jgi:hypothetical protein